MARKIGIDLGTANVLVYVKGRGIVLSEPSVVALSTRDNRIKAVGADALAMLGREPESIEVVRPLRNGVIADYDITQAMLKYFIEKANGRFSFNKPEVMICIPAGVTTVEMRAVRRAAEEAGARIAYLIREPLAAPAISVATATVSVVVFDADEREDVVLEAFVIFPFGNAATLAVGRFPTTAKLRCRDGHKQ